MNLLDLLSNRFDKKCDDLEDKKETPFRWQVEFLTIADRTVALLISQNETVENVKWIGQFVDQWVVDRL